MMSYEHLAPSRWRDGVATPEDVQRSAARLYGDAQRRMKKTAEDAQSVVSVECSVSTRWKTTKAASDVEAGFDRLFEDSKRWQKKAALKPPVPVTGSLKFIVGGGAILEPAPKLSEEERLSNLLKQHYKNDPLRARNRKKLLNNYCYGGLTPEEMRLLGYDKEPEVPTEEKLQQLAERELAEMERLRQEQADKLAADTRKMYEMSREYKHNQEEKDSKRDEEMRARLEVKFSEMKSFTAKLESDREEAKRRERDAMREQKRSYEEEQERITAKHEAEAARRLEERRAADDKRRDEEDRRNAARDAMMADQRKKERERVAKYKETLEANEGERSSAMCVEIRDFQAQADQLRAADSARRKEQKKKERDDLRAATAAYKERMSVVEEKQRQELEAKQEVFRKADETRKAEAMAREEEREANAKKMRAEDKARKKAIAEKFGSSKD